MYSEKLDWMLPWKRDGIKFEPKVSTRIPWVGPVANVCNLLVQNRGAHRCDAALLPSPLLALCISYRVNTFCFSFIFQIPSFWVSDINWCNSYLTTKFRTGKHDHPVKRCANALGASNRCNDERQREGREIRGKEKSWPALATQLHVDSVLFYHFCTAIAICTKRGPGSIISIRVCGRFQDST